MFVVTSAVVTVFTFAFVSEQFKKANPKRVQISILKKEIRKNCHWKAVFLTIEIIILNLLHVYVFYIEEHQLKYSVKIGSVFFRILLYIG